MMIKKSKRLFCLLLMFTMLISVLPSYAGDDTSGESIQSTNANTSEESGSDTEEESATQETSSKTIQENTQIEETVETSPSEYGSGSLTLESSSEDTITESVSEGTFSDNLSGSQEDGSSSEGSSEANATYQNNISGIIWLDENMDGVYDSDENPVEGYEVSLYLASDITNAAATATTDLNGEYVFNNITPGEYKVGVPLSKTVDGTEYLVPLVGISGDNKFGLDEITYDAYTETITIRADTQAAGYNGGVRLPAGIQPMALYTIDMGSPASVTGVDYSSSAETLTFNSSATNNIYQISGSSSTTRLVLSSAITVNITLSGCNLSHGTYSPIIIEGGGTVNLTITGSNTIKMTGTSQNTSYYTAGIYVDSSATLTITSNSTGSLTATGGIYRFDVTSTTFSLHGGAGIGGGSYSSSYNTSGTINIKGGTVTATGGGSVAAWGGAGIGGGGGSTGGYSGGGGSINISGGTVDATGGGYSWGGAGIGGGGGSSLGYGGAGGTIKISGGMVKATGGGTSSSGSIRGGAGTGGGSYGAGGTINISGGIVEATGGGTTTSTSTANVTEAYGGAGIGGGYYGAGGTINISGGTIEATGGGTTTSTNSSTMALAYGGAGIGGGYGGAGGVINISNGVVEALGGGVGSTNYITRGGAGIGGGCNGAGGDINISNGTIEATGGGTNTSSGTACGGAGIGGGYASAGGDITISGGDVTAAGGGAGTSNYTYGGAGIGGGCSGGAGGDINISGSTVMATGGGTSTSSYVYGGAGIGGGGYQGTGGDINISGSTVTATGGGTSTSGYVYGGAGMGGGGYQGTGGTITINGVSTLVTAVGGGTSVGYAYGGAGIGGGGYQGAGGTITIDGVSTQVTVSGGGTGSTNNTYAGAGIGGGGGSTGGYSGGGGSIYLTGGTVTATGGKSSNAANAPYAIGGGAVGTLATVVEISASITLAAYSQSSSYPAIGSSSITGNGYAVNGYIINRTSHTAISSIQITLDAAPSAWTLTLSTDYSGIAYSTGSSSAADNILVKDLSGTLIGAIVYDSGGSADIQPTQADATGQALRFGQEPVSGTLTAENVSKTTADIKSTDFSFITTTISNGGDYYLASDTGFTSNNQTHAWTSTTANPYTWNVSSLKSNTQYYYKSVLTNVFGTTTSSTKSFITLPDIISSSASVTGGTAASLSCSVADEGINTANITSINIYISATSSQPSSPYVTLTSGYTATGFINYDISGYGLIAGQTYYYWIEVSNETTYNAETIGGSTTADGTFTMAYTVTEKYVNENGSQIQSDTSKVIPITSGTEYYQYSGSLGDIVTSSGYYAYLGYTIGSYTAGQALITGTPEITSLSGDEMVYLVYEDLNTMINITVPGSFYWYADQTTETSSGSGTYEIKSGSYNIINNSDNLNLKVSLDSYFNTTGGRTFSIVSESNIQLNLTGDLTESSIGQDLFNGGASRFGTYTNTLYGKNYMLGAPSAADKRIWTFGFDGSYTGVLPTSGNEIADYTVMLTFSVTSTTP